MEKNEVRREFGSIAFATFLVGGALTTAAYCIPQESNAAEQVMENRRRVFSLQLAEAFAEADEVQPPADYDLENHERVVAAEGFLTCVCGGFHAPGDHGEPDRRYAVEGPRDNADPHLARLRDHERPLSRSFSLQLGKQSVLLADPDAPITPWGRESSQGMDEASARGEMWGDEIGAGAGHVDGQLRSSHGGATKNFEANLVELSEARVIHAGLQVQGPLRASDVLKSMLTAHAGVERCYRVALEKEPHLRAELALALEVLPEGKISELEVTGLEDVETRLASPTISQLKICLGEGVGSTEFPLRSGPSRIKYPLLLRPGG